MKSVVQKVLIVDDDTMLSELFSTGFQLAGFEVSVVNNGFDALEFMKTKQVDVITLDQDMPGLSGRDVLQQLRDQNLLENTKVIMVSANDNVALDPFYKQFADQVLIKPVGFRHLTQLARQLILDAESE